MTTCPTCNPDDLASLVDKHVDWDDEVYFLGKGAVMYFDLDALGAVEIVVDVPGSTYDSYGGIVEEDVFVVVKVQDRLFKKEGCRDSYGSVKFVGDCREVKGQPKTVTVFDYV